DMSGKRAPGLTDIGMITDMTWADVDNDGDPDMVIVGDWMPVKIFTNDKGIFTDESERFGLQNTEGWWHVIVARDLNGDGLVDFVLGNHGLNSRFKASVNQPITMYVNDFDLNGSIEQIICAYNRDISFPVVMKDDLVKQIPSLGMKYKKFDDYKEQTISDIFPDDVLQRAVKLNARIMESCVMINTGKGSFNLISLPPEAQFSPVYAVMADDLDRDGYCDMLLGGNQYRAKPETGIYDAGYGVFLKGNPAGIWQPVPLVTSGFFIRGEMRDLKILNIKGSPIIAVARNNDNLQFYKY
ncbi:MAG TPA: VCBS repeat-containing protein, partial [Bacteroidales bacterium]|nr:VCBS repeat-containing protein [Bacteroidales bacterium]